MPSPAEMSKEQLSSLTDQRLEEERSHYLLVRAGYRSDQDGYKWASKEIEVIQAERDRRAIDRRRKEESKRWLHGHHQ